MIGHCTRWQWRWALCLPVLLLCWRGPLESCSVLAANTTTSVQPFTSSVAPSPSSSPSSSPSPSPSSSSSPSSSPSPSPSPSPQSYFLKYVQPDCLYLYIDDLTIEIFTDATGYYNLTDANAAFVKAHSYNTSVSGCHTDSITFLQTYRFKNGSDFTLTFHFDLEPTSTDQTWYVSSFYHRNGTTTDRFTYTGLQSAISAPADMSYFCSDLRFKGQTIESVKSEVKFSGLRVQVFGLKGSNPSTTYIDCGARNKNNNTINLVVGLVVGGTLAISLVVIIVTLIVKRVRKRGYDLLDE